MSAPLSSPAGAANAAKASNIMQQASLKPTELKQMIKESITDMQNSLKDLTQELAGKESTGLKGKKSEKDIQSQLSRADMKGVPPELAAEIVGMIHGNEELEKQRKKRRKFEEKLDDFEELLSKLDPKTLTEDEKRMIEKFKKNLKTMKQLSRRLKQKEDEENELMMMLERYKKQKEQQNQK